MENSKYCIKCGAQIPADAYICPVCGANQNPQPIIEQPMNQNQNQNQYQNQAPIKEDSNRWLITLLLCWFLGYLGVHRFYTGHIGIGVVQLLTAGGCGIWVIVDLIMIISGSFKDSDGNPLKAKI